MTIEQLDAAHPGIASRCSEWKREPFGVHCDYSPGRRYNPVTIATLDSIAGAPVDMWLITMRGGEVATIYVQVLNRHFERVIAALKERFGPPTKQEDGQVQNRMGATFDQKELTWRSEGGVLSVKKRGGKIDTMSLMLTSEAKLSESHEQKKERAKTDAGDL